MKTRERSLSGLAVAIIMALFWWMMALTNEADQKPYFLESQVKAYQGAIVTLQYRYDALRDSLRIERESRKWTVPPDTLRMVWEAADRYGIDREVFTRLVWEESRFDPGAVSHRAAYGIAQVQLPTARMFEPKVAPSDLTRDAELNLDIAAQYFRRLLDRYSGDAYTALRAYNGGPTRVSRGDTRVGRSYARRILQGRD